ncbi:threonine-phosphate decarboxylase CobD [Fodinicurvata halophila]|uniref:threonine-phosphate decarboxylase n=1 Tax=Fodinicurvata halophila TaxID=1419723 RepID=A0ABV8UN96_9PROT
MTKARTELIHGGDLDSARLRHPGAQDHWIDLSTGINPWPYPLPDIPAEDWHRLPGRQALEALKEEARHFYGAGQQTGLVAAPGTQLLIQLLPRLFAPTRVEVAGFTYGEHERCWQLTGHEVAITEPDRDPDPTTRIRVVTRPNNPDGLILPRDRLMSWANSLAARDGLLVVDEAFAEVAPDCSLAPEAGHPGLCILRSFGKFFGLAGMRLGFALGSPELQRRIETALGPWAVPGPTLTIGTAALSDQDWSMRTRQALATQASQLDAVLHQAGLEYLGGTDLFRLYAHAKAGEISEKLAERGLLVRSFPEEPRWLRFGLPPDAEAMDRLKQALAHV